MKDDQQEAFEKALSTTLARVVDFLKFAETKNAALLTFSSAWILGSINFLTGTNGVSPDWKPVFTLALPLFAVAALIAIVSFLPRMKLSTIHHDPEQAKSLLYFGDVATFSPAAYKDRVRERYYPPDGEVATRNLLDDLSIQIAANSKITKRKMTFFYWGSGFILAAFAVLAYPSIKLVWHAAVAYFGRP
jgi:hypothetical protein